MFKQLRLFSLMALICLALFTLAACGQKPAAAPATVAPSETAVLSDKAAAPAEPESSEKAASSGSAMSSDEAMTPNNAVVHIIAEDMAFKLSADSAPAGRVTFVVVNQGKLGHEVVILKTDKDAKALPMSNSKNKVDEAAAGDNMGEVEVDAGATGAGTFRLTPGKYVLICNIDGHYHAGMEVALTVTGTMPEQQMASASVSVTEATEATPAAPAAPAESKEVTGIKAVRPNLVNTLAALKQGDLAAAKKAFASYDAAWNGVEVYINYRSPQLYADLETDLQAKIQKLLDDPQSKAEDITPLVEQELAKWDEAIKLVSEGPAISPLFDDVATLRMLRAATIRPAAPLLKAGDVAAARPLLQDFINRWSDVEDLIHERSVNAYSQTEDAMAQVGAALQKDNPDAAELTTLVATLTNRFNYGLSHVNAAARGSDLKKSAYTAEDVQEAAALGEVSAELKVSLDSWQGGSYQDAASHASRANEMFARVVPALQAKKGNDAAVQKALDAYIALADKAGDASAVSAANKAAAELIPVSQQWIVGQFWGNPELQEAIASAVQTQSAMKAQ